MTCTWFNFAYLFFVMILNWNFCVSSTENFNQFLTLLIFYPLCSPSYKFVAIRSWSKLCSWGRQLHIFSYLEIDGLSRKVVFPWFYKYCLFLNIVLRYATVMVLWWTFVFRNHSNFWNLSSHWKVESTPRFELINNEDYCFYCICGVDNSEPNKKYEILINALVVLLGNSG